MSHPKKIGPFTISGIISTTPSAKVLRGIDPQDRAPVAVKVLSITEPQFKARFTPALAAWDNLEVRGVARVLVSGGSERAAWFATEALPGRSLRELIDERIQSGTSFSRDEIVHIGHKVAEILLQCHVAGTLHGNLKPTNVFAGLDGRVTLTDLGMSRVLTKAEIQAKPELAPSCRHLSPEQLLGTQTNEASDAYQLGLLLYEMLALKHPTAGRLSEEELAEACRELVPPPVELDMPARVASAILHCLRRPREERPTTMRDFINEWSPAAAGPPLTVPPVTARGGFAMPSFDRPPASHDILPIPEIEPLPVALDVPSHQEPWEEDEQLSSSGGVFDEVPPTPEESGMEGDNPDDPAPQPYRRAVKGPRELDDIYSGREEEEPPGEESEPEVDPEVEAALAKRRSRRNQVLALVALILAISGAGAYYYLFVAALKVEGEVDQEVRLTGTVVTYRTTQPCSTAIQLTFGGKSTTQTNAKDGQTKTHQIELTGLTAGKDVRAEVVLPGGESGLSFQLKAPPAVAASHVKIEFKDTRLRVTFRTVARVKATLSAEVDGRPVEKAESDDSATDHDLSLDCPGLARIRQLTIGLKDLSGGNLPVSMASLGQMLIEPLAASLKSPTLTSQLNADGLEAALEKLNVPKQLEAIAAISPWIWETSDATDARPRLYDAVNQLEFLAADLPDPPKQLAAFRVIRATPEFSSVLLNATSVANYCGSALRSAPQTVGQLFTQLATPKPAGLIDTAQGPTSYDAKPRCVGSACSLTFPPPPPRAYGAAYVIVGVDRLPENGSLVMNIAQHQPEEIVLYNAAGRPAPAAGPIFCLRAMDAQLLSAGATTITVKMRSKAGAAPAPVVIGGLVVYR